MKTRTTLQYAALGLLAAASLAAPAAAQSWPTKPVRIVIPYAPGGASDTMARPWAEKLSQAFGQQFVVENKGGAGGAIGTEAVAKAAPDGYTFLKAPNGPLTIVPHLRKAPYDPMNDFVPVARAGDLVCGFVVNPVIPVNTLPELIAYSKANPGKVFYGSAGLATGTHLRLEMLKLRTGADITHVPYRGSAEALGDLLGGSVHMMNEIVVLPHVKAGKLKYIATSYATRHPDFPNTPTLTELGYPESDVPIWYAFYAPKGTSPEIVNRLNAEIVKIAQTPEMKQRMLELSIVVPTQTPAEVAEMVRKDSAANAQLIKQANVKLE